MSEPASTKTLTTRCHGSGILVCRCAGDFCMCGWHGEAECFGCPDCEWDDEEREEYWNSQEELFGGDW